MPPILSVKNLTTRFEDHVVLKDVSFTLEAGDELAVIGPNGSGKSVLLKSLLGILPHDGEVRWAPEARLGYVPQKIDADRHLPLTIKNLLTAKAKLLGLGARDIHASIETVGLASSIAETPVGHLSGGQFQKALIAFALLGSPNVILFDEPTASLDQLAEEHVYELVHQLRTGSGITVILVSHDLSVVSRYATKVLCLNKEAVCFGTPQEALSPDVVAKLYSGPQKFYHHHATSQNPKSQ